MRLSERAKTGWQLAGGFAILFPATIVAGSVFRREVNPWVWAELQHSRAPGSLVEAGLTIFVYGCFYSMGFLLPYWVITFLLFLQRHAKFRTPTPPPMPLDHRAGRLLAAGGCQVLFVLLLESIMSFFRALPSEIWNGWFLIMGLASAGYLLAGSYFAFARASGSSVHKSSN